MSPTVPTLTVPSAAARSRQGSLFLFADVLRSEARKLRTVRSTFWTLTATVVFNVVIAALAAVFIPPNLNAADLAKSDPVRLSLAGLHLSQIAIGVLGALVITSEYGTGMIRATFAAVPQRRLVLAAKSLVFAAVAWLIGTLSSFGAYLAFQAFLPGTSLQTSLGDPGVFRAVAGGGLYLAMLGLLGLGLGAVLRTSAGTIATLFGLLFVPSILIDLLPSSWQITIGPYLPMEAGSDIFIATRHDPGSLTAWTGFGVFSLYAMVVLAVGFLLITRRDA